MTEDSEKAILVSTKELEQVMCIQYPITFPGGITQDGSSLDPVSTLLNLGSKVNAIHLVFAKMLELVVRTTNIAAQKIYNTTHEIYKIVVAAFLVTDQGDRIRFFEKTFFVANISPNMVFGMLFLTLSGADVNFPKRKLR